MKIKTSCIFTLSALLLSIPVYASSVTGKIEYLLPHAGDVVFLNIVGENKITINSQGTNSNCITASVGNFRVDLSNETGAAIYAALLMAQAQDKEISIHGANTCTSNRENVSWVLLR